EEFYPQEIEQERRQKKQQLVEERNALRETLSAPVSREQASGDLLAEIADIHDMSISRFSAFFSILETYERDIPKLLAISLCVLHFPSI
ncbi:Peptidase, S54 (Rhomboid) family, partial [human gut metagenome]